ncbi:hypothetical protein CBL_06953 [Carabus blaptoides fortunei]
MAAKLIVLFAVLAVANAGNLFSPATYAAGPALSYAAPAVSTLHAAPVLRTAAIAAPAVSHSYVRQNSLSYAAAPALSYAAPAVASYAAHSPVVSAYAAPAVSTYAARSPIVSSYAAHGPVVSSYAAPVIAARGW